MSGRRGMRARFSTGGAGRGVLCHTPTGTGRHRATGTSGAGRRGALALACLSLLALAGLFAAGAAQASSFIPSGSFGSQGSGNGRFQSPLSVAAQPSLFSPVGSFGSPGSGPGQFQSPQGVAVQASSGNVYVADSGNARVEKFSPDGSFISAFGQDRLSFPTSVATDTLGKVYVGDAGTNVVQKFDADGNFVSTIDGASAPQGHFQSLAGVAVDQANNLWVADSGTSNVIEFGPKGGFLRQWHDSCPDGPLTAPCATDSNPSAIAVDSAHNAVYLIDVFGGYVNRYSLTGNWQREIDRSVIHLGTFSTTTPSALALDPGTGNLYVDHSGTPADVTVYNHNGVKLDDLSLGQNTNSHGLAFASLSGGANKPGQGRLYVSDASNNNVTIYAPRRTPGAPLITSESADQSGRTTATLRAGIVPLGSATSCHFVYVGNTDFQASGFANATSVACSPASLGSGFGYVAASAGLSGLTTGAYYHFRVVATSLAGTTTGEHQEFQAGPGAWSPFYRCPVDDPAMLATDSTNTGSFCVASNSTHGSIKIGNLPTTPTANTNLQIGLAGQLDGPIVAPPGGALVADPVQITGTPVGTVTAVTQSAGAPSNFNLFAGISTGVPIITLPTKIQLQNPALGPSCYIGSDQDPIVLQPSNTDLSQAEIHQAGLLEPFDENGVPNLTGPLTSLVSTGAVQGDDTFAVPGANGCGPNGSLDPVVDAVVGLPSPSGNNHLVLDDATSALSFPGFGFGNALTGEEVAAAWHVGFGP
jgi:DNA-binding beta-propeller fold protein YncE